MPGQALGLAEAQVVTISAQGNLFDAARTLLLCAKCYRERALLECTDEEDQNLGISSRW